MSAIIGRPVKLAVYRALKGDDSWETVFRCERGSEGPDMMETCGYLRISEPMEVTFTPRAVEEVVPAELAALDVEEKQITAEYLAKLNPIQTRRRNLLSIAAPSEP